MSDRLVMVVANQQAAQAELVLNNIGSIRCLHTVSRDGAHGSKERQTQTQTQTRAHTHRQAGRHTQVERAKDRQRQTSRLTQLVTPVKFGAAGGVPGRVVDGV